MLALTDMHASVVRPVLRGRLGAISAAHPLAAAAGQEVLTAGGSAVDAVIAAQAVLCVVAPEACGLGGDMFCLVREPGGAALAVNGAGHSAMAPHPAPSGAQAALGASVTVPGIVHAWHAMAARWSRLPFAAVMAPAVRIARGGFAVRPQMARAAAQQRARLVRGGAEAWAMARAAPGDRVEQHELARLLERVAKEGPGAFYAGPVATAIARVVRAQGGALAEDDFAAHRTLVAPPIRLRWRDATILLQPPMSQGVLLGMALRGLEMLGPLPAGRLDHAGIELTEASFAHRDAVARGEALLTEPLQVDLARAARRGGPRAYLHTAGASAADRDGMVVASLASVFDDFGSCIFVPEAGLVLNNRGDGFTGGANAAAPGKMPVHTLAPVIVEASGFVLGLSTPGADGQVQTLFQVLTSGQDLATVIAQPRWRTEGGRVLVESSHGAGPLLRGLGHEVVTLPDGDIRFGAVTAAAATPTGPVAVSDWRRETWSGVA